MSWRDRLALTFTLTTQQTGTPLDERQLSQVPCRAAPINGTLGFETVSQSSNTVNGNTSTFNGSGSTTSWRSRFS